MIDLHEYLKKKHQVVFDSLIDDLVKEAQKEERDKIKLLLASFDLNEAIEKIEVYEETER